MRSVSVPPTKVEITSGASVAAATRPIWLALPVVSHTNHGIARFVIWLPRLERRFAVSIQQTGHRLTSWLVVGDPSGPEMPVEVMGSFLRPGNAGALWGEGKGKGEVIRLGCDLLPGACPAWSRGSGGFAGRA